MGKCRCRRSIRLGEDLHELPQRKWLLIDGYNLLHASGVFGSGGRTSLESSREALLDWLGDTLSDAQRRRTTIVFDARFAPPGLPRSLEKHEMQIRFAPRGCEADDLLEQLMREHSTPRALVVVSSDHRLQRAARRRQATPIDSQQWVAEVRSGTPRKSDRHDPPGREEFELSPDEVQAWLDEFTND